jgi:hypothetical protein
MTVIRNSAVIQCRPDEAFDYLSDPRVELEWNPKCEVMEKLTEGRVGPGTKYRAKWKNSPSVELEMVAFERPHTWTMHNGGAIEVTFTASVKGVTEGTRLSVEFVPRPHGWLRLVYPLFLLAIRRDEKRNMDHIRDALERHARSSPKH